MNKSTITGEEIRALRLEHGLTQRECASRIGVGIRMWQKYEQGHPCKQLYLDHVFMRTLPNEEKQKSYLNNDI
jgi:DNA-binding XRE family transcriptional regulator